MIISKNSLLFFKKKEPIARLNVWVLDGDTAHKNLLKFALNAQTIEHAMVIITIDLSQPWDLVESLTKWLQVLEEHVKQIFSALPLQYVDQLRKKRKHQKKNQNQKRLKNCQNPRTKKKTKSNTTFPKKKKPPSNFRLSTIRRNRNKSNQIKNNQINQNINNQI